MKSIHELNKMTLPELKELLDEMQRDRFYASGTTATSEMQYNIDRLREYILLIKIANP